MKKVKLPESHNWTTERFGRQSIFPTYREDFLSSAHRRNRCSEIAVLILCGACLAGLAIILAI